MPEAPVKTSYTNLIEQWYNDNNKPPQLANDDGRFNKGMMMSISNNQLYHNDIIDTFKKAYISLLVALTDKKFTKYDVKLINGEWHRDRVKLPSRNKLLDLISNKIPVMLCGVHNYKKDDIRSGGKEYCHSHFYVYNAHHYLPSNPVDLADKEDKIKRHLSRYINQRKRLQNHIRVTPVGQGIYKYTDKVSPLTLYDYLSSPNTQIQDKNVINYIANNKHLPDIQYPLSFIYLNKKL